MLRLAQQLTGGHAVSARRPDERRIEHVQIARVSRSPRLESLPPVVVYDARLAVAGRQPQIGVVDAQHQPMLGARREHPIRL